MTEQQHEAPRTVRVVVDVDVDILAGAATWYAWLGDLPGTPQPQEVVEAWLENAYDNSREMAPTEAAPYRYARESYVYLDVVERADREAIKPWLTRTCTECDQEVALGVSDGHLLTTDGWVAVGCEGYWLVSPRALGLPGHDGWDDWTQHTGR